MCSPLTLLSGATVSSAAFVAHHSHTRLSLLLARPHLPVTWRSVDYHAYFTTGKKLE